MSLHETADTVSRLVWASASSGLLGRRVSRLAARLALPIVLPVVLAACSFAPVYGGDPDQYAARYESPDSRLEQIVYQEVTARLGETSDPKAPLVAIDVSAGSIEPGPDAAGLRAVIKVTEPDPAGRGPGNVIFEGTRTASASYTDSPQLLADQQARNEAAERAARDLAESVRLTLIGVLGNRPAAAMQ